MDVFKTVRRGDLDRLKVDRVGRGTQGNIYKISVAGRTAALKDISKRNFFYRVLIGRWLLSREIRTYGRLQGVPGIPVLYHRIDRDGFLFEYVEGRPLSDLSKDAPLPAAFFDALADLVTRMHDRGVVHADLKHKKNILVTPSHRPVLIDFGASWISPAPWNLPKRWVYGQFRQIDLRALSKIRHRFDAANPDAGDRENLARRNILERCGSLYQWGYRFFSKKHRWRRRRSASGRTS